MTQTMKNYLIISVLTKKIKETEFAEISVPYTGLPLIQENEILRLRRKFH